MRMKSRCYNILCWWKIETDFHGQHFFLVLCKSKRGLTKRKNHLYLLFIKLSPKLVSIYLTDFNNLISVWIGNTKLGNTYILDLGKCSVRSSAKLKS